MVRRRTLTSLMLTQFVVLTPNNQTHTLSQPFICTWIKRANDMHQRRLQKLCCSTTQLSCLISWWKHHKPKKVKLKYCATFDTKTLHWMGLWQTFSTYEQIKTNRSTGHNNKLRLRLKFSNTNILSWFSDSRPP